MGAAYCSIKMPLMGKEILKKEFQILQHSMQLENGADAYAGHLGIKAGLLIMDKQRFDSEDAASKYAMKMSDSSDPAVAVQLIGDLSISFPVTAKDKDLQGRFSKISKIIDSFPALVTVRAKSMRSKLYTCRHCDSKISTKHVKDIYCPVCSQVFLYTDTDAERLKAWINKREKIRGQIFTRTVEIKRKYAGQSKRGYMWYIGGWCRE